MELLQQCGKSIILVWNSDLIGFRSISDVDGPKIVDNFYAYLFKEQSTVIDTQPDTSQAAHALHFAVTKLRSENVPFARWVPFIHLGK